MTRPNGASPGIDQVHMASKSGSNVGLRLLSKFLTQLVGVIKVKVWHKCYEHRASERPGVSFKQT